MMQDYDFQDTDTFSSPASTDIQPPEQAVRNILSFARSYQTIEIEGVPIEFFLN